MKQPERSPAVKLIADWLFKADQDIRSAEALMALEPPLLFPSFFHSQQAAEKYLKALLTHRGVEIPKTHELGTLLKRLEPRDAPLVQQLIDTIVLNTYAVDIRYPGWQPEPGIEETRHALALARRVRDAVLPLLPQVPDSKQ